MKIVLLGVIITLIPLLNACGADSEGPNLTQEPNQSQQGILSDQQQQALEAANSVEQTLLDAAADRAEELEARLRAQ